MPIEEYVFLSGKGGSGKTSVCAAWAHLNQEMYGDGAAVVVDADVDAANLELLSRCQRAEEHPFIGAALPVLEEERCTGCGLCEDICRFDALTLVEGEGGSLPVIDEVLCEGCGACMEVCPFDGFEMVPQQVGSWFRSGSRFGPLFHAALLPGGENSGKLVARVRQEARGWAEGNGYELILTDGPPGIGCPVISALTGASGIIAVTEAGEAGRSDLQRLLELARRFDLPVHLLINKADIHPEAAGSIERLCREEERIGLLGRIPYDPAVVHRMVAGEPVTVDPSSPAAAALRESFERWAAERPAPDEGGRGRLYRISRPS